MSDSHLPTRSTAKSPTGISGFDDITLGGLPTGRPTLVCGTAGCGKTLFAATVLVHGARELNEPGVREAEAEKAQPLIEQRRRRTLAQIEILHSELEADEAELRELIRMETDRRARTEMDEAEMRNSRGSS